MRTGVIFSVIVSLCCPATAADEIQLPTSTAAKPPLAEVVKQLATRVAELEKELSQVRKLQQQSVIGATLFLDEREHSDEKASVATNAKAPLLLADESSCCGKLFVDSFGIIRDPNGQAVGYWGFDANSRVENVAPRYRR